MNLLPKTVGVTICIIDVNMSLEWASFGFDAARLVPAPSSSRIGPYKSSYVSVPKNAPIMTDEAKELTCNPNGAFRKLRARLNSPTAEHAEAIVSLPPGRSLSLLGRSIPPTKQWRATLNFKL